MARRQSGDQLARGRVTRLRRAWSLVSPLLPPSGKVDELVLAVAKRRGRVIRVLACDLPPGAPSGVWIPSGDIDYVIHPAEVAAAHRTLVICHELAHMLLDHDTQQAEFDVSVFAPSIRPEVAARFLTRHAYDDQIETEAELLATELATELARRAAAGRTAAIVTSDTVSERLR